MIGKVLNLPFKVLGGVARAVQANESKKWSDHAARDAQAAQAMKGMDLSVPSDFDPGNIHVDGDVVTEALTSGYVVDVSASSQSVSRASRTSPLLKSGFVSQNSHPTRPSSSSLTIRTRATPWCASSDTGDSMRPGPSVVEVQPGRTRKTAEEIGRDEQLESPTITTDRLVIRPMTVGDLKAVHLFTSAYSAQRYGNSAGGHRCRLRRSVHGRHDRTLWTSPTVRSGVTFDRQLIGGLAFRQVRVVPPAVEVGWVLHPEMAGKGLATEAVRVPRIPRGGLPGRQSL